MTDHDKTHTLLQVAELAGKWPHLRSTHDLAMSDLAVSDKEAKEELAKRAEVKAKADAEAKAKLEAIAKTQGEVPTPPVSPVVQRRLFDTPQEQH